MVVGLDCEFEVFDVCAGGTLDAALLFDCTVDCLSELSEVIFGLGFALTFTS